MSALKKIFGSGDSRDDEVMYQTETNSAPSTAIANADRPIQSERDIGAGPHSAYGITSSTATANTDRAIQSERDIGTGAQSNPGITSKLGDTSNVQSQSQVASSAAPILQDSTTTSSTGTKSHWSPTRYAGQEYNVMKTEPAGTTTGSVIQDRSTTGPTTTTTGATTAAVAGTGATVYASDRYDPGTKQDDISNATYTERSYKIGSSPSTSRPTTSDNSTAVGSAGSTATPTTYTVDGTTGGGSSYGKEAAGTGAAVFGTTTIGAGAYTASQRDDNQLSSDTQTRDIPGAFPTEDASNRSAGGASVAAVDRNLGYAPAERQSYYGRPPSSPPVSPPPTKTSFAESSKPPQQDEQHYGRDAAIAGGVAGGAAAVGYGTYQATRSSDTPATTTAPTPATPTTPTKTTTSPATQGSQRTLISSLIDPREEGDDLTKTESRESPYGCKSSLEGVSPYGRSSFGESARPDISALTSSGNEARTSESSYGPALGAGAVGAGVMGAGATYAATRDEGSPITQVDSGISTASSGERKQGFFSKAVHGARKDEEVSIGGSNPSNEIERVSRGGDEFLGDDGLIHFVKEGADPDAPALIVREAPGGGIETMEERR